MSSDNGGTAGTTRPGAEWALREQLGGDSYPLETELIIGREVGCDIVLTGGHASRQHAKISLKDGVVSVEDLKSTNGTFVNGERVERSELKPGDELRFDTHLFVVDGPAATTEPATAPQATVLRSAVVEDQPSSGAELPTEPPTTPEPEPEKTTPEPEPEEPAAAPDAEPAPVEEPPVQPPEPVGDQPTAAADDESRGDADGGSDRVPESDAEKAGAGEAQPETPAPPEPTPAPELKPEPAPAGEASVQASEAPPAPDSQPPAQTEEPDTGEARQKAWWESQDEGPKGTRLVDSAAIRDQFQDGGTQIVRGMGNLETPSLIGTMAPCAGQVYNLSKKITIVGRAAASDIVVDEGSVSARHAQVICDGGTWKVEDLLSANGTFVNGKKSQVAFLSAGDAVRFGRIEMRFVLGDTDVPSQAAAEQSEIIRGSGSTQKKAVPVWVYALVGFILVAAAAALLLL